MTEARVHGIRRLAQTIEVHAPRGAVEVQAIASIPDRADTIIAIAHGAGAGMAHPFLTGLAEELAARGYATVRFNFPYVEAGRRMPGPASHAIATWQAVAEESGRLLPGGRFVAAGKSYGGRMASMAAADGTISPSALVYLGYPLHPPGRPEKDRSAHLPQIAAPQLFVEGTTDPFVVPHEGLEAAVASCQDATLEWIDGGGHSFEVKGAKRPPDEIGAGLAPLVAAFVRRVAAR